LLALRRRLQVELIHYAPHKPLVLMTWPGRDASLQSILLNSHTDVVPAEPSFWRHARALALPRADALTCSRLCELRALTRLARLPGLAATTRLPRTWTHAATSSRAARRT
jgi:hypothetical protein